MSATVLYPMSYNKDMELSLVQGNKKIGRNVFALNFLPGDEPLSVSTKGQLTDIKGTCSGCCEGCANACYAIRDTKRYHNTCVPALGKNTLIMRHNIDGLFTQLEEKLTKKKAQVLRYHSSGEIENFNYLLHMVKLAVKMPDVKFYCYTKRFNFVQKYLTEYGMFPENLTVNISVWNGNDKGYNFEGLNKFVYDDGSDPEVAKLFHCKAVDPNGKSTGLTCDKCGRCFRGNKGLVTAVYAH